MTTLACCQAQDEPDLRPPPNLQMGMVECLKGLFARKLKAIRAEGFSYAKIHLAVSLSCQAPPPFMEYINNSNTINDSDTL
ncbi:MAG: hypothetical protein CMF31_00575 [Kordiimonas sp.]|nr:hypothetical protein [Kordiimonas sp.]